LGNRFVLDSRETLIFTPPTAIALLLTLRVALGPEVCRTRRW
jgi:hypothetical protein